MFGFMKCPECGAKVKDNLNFCGDCGSKMDKERTNCIHCGGETTIGKFCSLCGKHLVHAAKPEIKEILWARGPSDIAARLAIDDIDEFLNKKVGVSVGTRPLFFQGRRIFGDLEPGTHNAGSILRILSERAPAYIVFFDTGDINLSFSVEQIRTADPTEGAVNFTLVVRLDEIKNFYTNFMKDRTRVSLADIQDNFKVEIADIVESIVSTESIKAFTPKGEFTKKLEHRLRSDLREQFGRMGITLVRISILACKFLIGDKIADIWEETFKKFEVNKAKLDQFKKMMAQKDEIKIAEIVKEYNQLNRAEKRSLLQDRLDKFLTKERIREFKNGKEYELYLRKLENEFAKYEVSYEKEETVREKEKLIRDDEMRDLVWTFEEKGEDHEIFRKHTLVRVKLENELELRERVALAHIELIGKERALKQGIDLDIERKKLYEEIEQRRMRFEADQKEAWERFQTQKKTVKEKAELDVELTKMEAEKRCIMLDQELDEKEKKMRMGQLALREMSLTEKMDRFNKLEAQQAEDEHQLQVRRKEQELANQERMDELTARLKKAAELSKITLEEETARSRVELQRIDALSKVSVETLISVSDSDRALLLKDLASTRALQGFSEEQILAMNAKESPHIAEALKEKYARASSEKVEKMYEKMLAEKDKTSIDSREMYEKSSAESRQMYEQFAGMMKSTFEKALENQRDTSIAVSEGMKSTFQTAIETQRDTAVATTQGARPNVIATPAGNQMTVVSAGVGAGIPPGQSQAEKKEPAQAQVICQKCSWMMTAGSKFCQNCGIMLEIIEKKGDDEKNLQSINVGYVDGDIAISSSIASTSPEIERDNAERINKQLDEQTALEKNKDFERNQYQKQGLNCVEMPIYVRIADVLTTVLEAGRALPAEKIIQIEKDHSKELGTEIEIFEGNKLVERVTAYGQGNAEGKNTPVTLCVKHCGDSLDIVIQDSEYALTVTESVDGQRRYLFPLGKWDTVDCSVFAPPEVSRGESFLVQVFAHMPVQAEIADEMAQEFDENASRRTVRTLNSKIARGSKLGFHLCIPNLEERVEYEEIIWRGRPSSAQFSLTIPDDFNQKILIGTVTISQDGVPLGKALFKMTVLQPSRVVRDDLQLAEKMVPFNVFFVSYASKDRSEVIKRIQMLKMLGKRIIQDILSLDPGDRWQRKLYRLIDESDAVLLFWSSNARESEWVIKECRYTIDTKGLESLIPVIIEGPPPVEPPAELAGLHMNDRLLYFM